MTNINGLEHLQYAVAHTPDMSRILQTLFFIGDRILAREMEDNVLREALAIVFGGSIEAARGEGMLIYREMMREFMTTYMDTCAWLGAPRDRALMPPVLTGYLD